MADGKLLIYWELINQLWITSKAMQRQKWNLKVSEINPGEKLEKNFEFRWRYITEINLMETPNTKFWSVWAIIINWRNVNLNCCQSNLSFYTPSFLIECKYKA